ncbi:hypothetical protein L484_026843 [Morus notabilis]|uniref:Uncharacterized protein n=1 Tax=Morus notabilis TaxID=981085 RepID=W9RE49_9ROSA|nr:hypothetical protein L484_026843 [Morus notabilis]
MWQERVGQRLNGETHAERNADRPDARVEKTHVGDSWVPRREERGAGLRVRDWNSRPGLGLAWTERARKWGKIRGTKAEIATWRGW